MNEQNLEKTKVELAREAKAERLHEQTLPDGSKKPLKLKTKSYNWLIASLAAIVLVISIIWGSFSFGYAQKYLSAVTVGKHNISITEYQYIYNTAAQNIIQYARQAGQQVNLNAPSPFSQKGETWRQVIDQYAHSQIQNIYSGYDQAKTAGIELDAKDLEQVEQSIKDFKANYTNDNEFAQTLIANFGRGVDEQVIRNVYQKQVLANKYRKEAPRKINFSDEEIEKIYQAKKDDYDVFDFMLVKLQVPGQEPLVEPEYPKAPENADTETRKKINEEAATLRKEYDEKVQKQTKDNFNRTFKLVSAIDDKQLTLANPQAFLQFVEANKQYVVAINDMKNVSPYRYQLINSFINETEARAFVMAQERKAGDVKVIPYPNQNVVYVVMYNGRYRDEKPTIHAGLRILTNAEIEKQYRTTHKIDDKTELTDAQKAEAKQSAQTELEQYLVANQTAESMQNKEVANYHTTFIDMKDFVESTSPFELNIGQWLVDSSRKAGDHQVFSDTNYGLYAINYFAKLDRAGWQSTLTFKEQNEKFNNEQKELIASDEYKVSNTWSKRFADLVPFLQPHKAA